MMVILYFVKSHSEDAVRVSQAEKDRSHARIVESAARLLRTQGVAGASVGEVMKDAGLTHGGFYRHFDSKEDLLEAALKAAFDEMTDPLETALQSGAAGSAVRSFNDFYVSEVHAANPGRGCPVAAVSGEMGRAAERLKVSFGLGVRRMIDLLAKAEPEPEPDADAAATRRLAMMAGAVMIARASDPDTARQVLQACRTPVDAHGDRSRS